MSFFETNKSAQGSQSKMGITIGIPLFNEEGFIEATIKSASRQCEYLLVSDNCSTDESFKICDRLRQELDNLIVVRHEKNHGAVFNFKYLLDLAQTPYFMWLGGHDLLSDDYTSNLKEALEEDTDSVLAYGSAKHINSFGVQLYDYDYYYSDLLNSDDSTVRLHALVRHLFDCSMVHGLFRTQTLRLIWRNYGFRGGDHVLLSDAAMLGKFSYRRSAHLIRRNVRDHYSSREQLRRITGTAPLISSPSFRQMQVYQFELAKSVSRSTKYETVLFHANIYLTLVARFGVFSESRLTSMIEAFIFTISRAFRFVSRRVSPIFTRLKSIKAHHAHTE